MLSTSLAFCGFEHDYHGQLADFGKEEKIKEVTYGFGRERLMQATRSRLSLFHQVQT